VRAAIPVALELPGGGASDVDVELIESRAVAVAGELHLELHVIFRDDLAANLAARTDPRPAPGTVRSSGRQLSSADYFSGFYTQDLLVGHGSHQGPAGWSCQMPGGPDACSRHPGSPMEGKSRLLSLHGPRE